MAQKPVILQKLKHGKLLNHKTAPQFVETFNYIVDWINNFRGDGQIGDGSEGNIFVDGSNDARPVVRFEGELSSSGGGSSDSYVDTKSNFALIRDNNTVKINNGYVMLGRLIRHVNGINVTQAGYIILKVGMGTLSYDIQILQGQQTIPITSNEYSYIPLYRLDQNLEVINDFRIIPQVQRWE